MPSTLKSHYWAAVFCTAAVALTSAAFADDAFGPMAVPAAAQPFKLGPLQLIALRDAQFVMHNDGKTFGSAADVATVGNLLKASNLPDDRLTLSVNALLVRAGKRVILIDSGLGPAVHGALMASLGEAGVAPDEVTDVLITHSHFDHVGGLAGADGKLAFPERPHAGSRGLRNHLRQAEPARHRRHGAQLGHLIEKARVDHAVR